MQLLKKKHTIKNQLNKQGRQPEKQKKKMYTKTIAKENNFKVLGYYKNFFFCSFALLLIYTCSCSFNPIDLTCGTLLYAINLE